MALSVVRASVTICAYSHGSSVHADSILSRLHGISEVIAVSNSGSDVSIARSYDVYQTALAVHSSNALVVRCVSHATVARHGQRVGEVFISVGLADACRLIADGGGSLADADSILSRLHGISEVLAVSNSGSDVSIARSYDVYQTALAVHSSNALVVRCVSHATVARHGQRVGEVSIPEGLVDSRCLVADGGSSLLDGEGLRHRTGILTIATLGGDGHRRCLITGSRKTGVRVVAVAEGIDSALCQHRIAVLHGDGRCQRLSRVGSVSDSDGDVLIVHQLLVGEVDLCIGALHGEGPLVLLTLHGGEREVR